MSFALRTPTAIKQTDLHWRTEVLEAGTCGLFRAPLDEAAALMPSMAKLVATVPVLNARDYEIDIKVHMLMKGQYPCIPNWHTDMVDRDERGLRFDMIDPNAPTMLLWISDGPETEFLARPLEMPEMPGSHQEIARFLRTLPPRDLGGLFTQSIQPNVWWSMDQQTPHRGTAAAKHGWRVFARVTHKSLAPARPAISTIRRHAQVYLDAREFSW